MPPTPLIYPRPGSAAAQRPSNTLRLLSFKRLPPHGKIQLPVAAHQPPSLPRFTHPPPALLPKTSVSTSASASVPQPSHLPPRSPRLLDLPLPRPLISSKGLTGSLHPHNIPPTSTIQTLKRPFLLPFFPQNPAPTLSYFPAFSHTTGLPPIPTFSLPTSPPPTLATQSQSQSLPPTILPTVIPHPVFKRDYGGLHYDEYDGSHYAEYHYHDGDYHNGEEIPVQTIESISPIEIEASTYLPSTFPTSHPNKGEPFPSNQDPGLDSVAFPLPASSASASTSGGSQFTLFLLLTSTLWVEEFFFWRLY